MNKRVEVNPLPEKNQYYIDIGSGLYKKIDKYLAKYYTRGKIFLVSDENVFSIYGNSIITCLQRNNYSITTYIVPPGEGSKHNNYLQKGYNKLIENNFDRNNLIIALGGGVVGDLAGYLAATYMRGLDLIQIPTSLLAQVDSSVGGKTAINHPQGKNLIGSFYQPIYVLIDIDFLQTLADRELKSGMAEVIKYGLISDREFLTFLDGKQKSVYNLKKETILHIINTCCQIKSDIVNIDQKENGKRMILNFGHTIGHGLEAAAGYKGLKHGEAVAVGMIGAAKLSYFLGYLSKKELQLIIDIISQYKFNTKIEADPDELYQIMKHDKKVKNNRIRWVLLKEIASTVIRDDVDEVLIKKVVEGLNCPK